MRSRDFDDPEFDEHEHHPPRRRSPRPDPSGPDRRGRLTESERARLARRRDDEYDHAGTPVTGDRWSSWDVAEHGPEPHPDWLVTELGAVDTELGLLKTGKEADVHLLERRLPESGRRCLLAAKRYRTPEHRMFHRDAGYLEGRRMRRSREMRAMSGRTAFGRNLLAQQWAVAEFGALGRLWSQGIPVPYPVQRDGTELLLEFLGGPDGSAAPRLAQLRPDPGDLDDLWHSLVDTLGRLARLGLAHGDLSAYNVLVHHGLPVLIDLPQVVDVVANPLGVEYLSRDVHNICGWFRGRGLAAETVDPETLLATLLGMAF